MTRQFWLFAACGVLMLACDYRSNLGQIPSEIGSNEDAGSELPGGEMDAGNPPPPAPRPKRIFVTSTTYSGDFKTLGGAADGAAGADRLCMLAAQSVGIPGTFKAWVSLFQADAINRIADVGPWHQFKEDGSTLVTFNNLANVAGTPLTKIRYTERGDLADGCVWTGTSTGGRAASNCNSFSAQSAYGTSGRIDSTAALSEWTEAESSRCDSSCSSRKHLYCFEQ